MGRLVFWWLWSVYLFICVCFAYTRFLFTVDYVYVPPLFLLSIDAGWWCLRRLLSNIKYLFRYRYLKPSFRLQTISWFVSIRLIVLSNSACSSILVFTHQSIDSCITAIGQWFSSLYWFAVYNNHWPLIFVWFLILCFEFFSSCCSCIFFFSLFPVGQSFFLRPKIYGCFFLCFCCLFYRNFTPHL